MLRRFLFVVCFALLALDRAVLADSLLKDNDVVAICGDSITEQKQYSVFIETYLLACKPAQNLRTVQIGWSGETAPGFAGRVASDVLPFKPTVATTFYGMNDGGYAAIKPATGTTFHDALKVAVQALQAGGVRTVLVGSPGCVDSSTFKRIDHKVYNETLGALGDISHTVANETKSPFIDIHNPMMDTMAAAKAKYGKAFGFAGPGDGVHPAAAGHLLIAYEFLKGLGCDGDLGTITLDMAATAANHNSTTRGHRIVSAQDGVIAIESTRYCFCFFGDGKSPDSELATANLIPFTADLNRLTLLVKNAGPGQLRVTWGDKSKDFSSDELGKGINLAAEFPDNPFADSFGHLEKLVHDKQDFETLLTKVILHQAPDEKTRMPELAGTIDTLIAGAMKHDKVLADAVAAEAAKPVLHTIKIEPVP